MLKLQLTVTILKIFSFCDSLCPFAHFGYCFQKEKSNDTDSEIKDVKLHVSVRNKDLFFFAHDDKEKNNYLTR